MPVWLFCLDMCRLDCNWAKRMVWWASPKVTINSRFSFALQCMNNFFTTNFSDHKIGSKTCLDRRETVAEVSFMFHALNALYRIQLRSLPSAACSGHSLWHPPPLAPRVSQNQLSLFDSCSLLLENPKNSWGSVNIRFILFQDRRTDKEMETESETTDSGNMGCLVKIVIPDSGRREDVNQRQKSLCQTFEPYQSLWLWPK